MKDREQNHLKVLTEDEIERIHHTSLGVLEEIGVHVPDGEILGKLYAPLPELTSLDIWESAVWIKEPAWLN